MADEVTPIEEVAQSSAPVEPVVVSEESVAPVVETPNPVEAPIEATLNSAEVESGTTAQTLNPTEVGSGEVGENEPLAPAVEPLKMDSGSGSGMTQGGGEESKPTEALPPSVPVALRSGIRELLVKAQSVIQFRKRKKLDQVMGLFAKRTSVTNDDVEKLLHVSDATATRYLSILEKEGKIKQTGKTGKGVLYTRN